MNATQKSKVVLAACLGGMALIVGGIGTLAVKSHEDYNLQTERMIVSIRTGGDILVTQEPVRTVKDGEACYQYRGVLIEEQSSQVPIGSPVVGYVCMKNRELTREGRGLGTEMMEVSHDGPMRRWIDTGRFKQ
ncbi:hypothetical protein BAJUN_00860 [Bajunvirus bajun]|uniref:Uncharacterized protein n=1 Tax=Brevundimonas phage vB_BgoS-Bajun TaxID=2948594 RepID=A0A9E7N7K5_9CAUD|nr:hypothetical protein BAJUN_00860 [Brevundimonas phage vB_BgoS-Bajun]